MKPISILILGIIFITIINIGNACSPAFKTKDVFSAASSSLSTQTCLADESNLNPMNLRELRKGYLGETEVLYLDRKDGWIQVDSDKLYLTKNGRLPESKLDPGVSQGVGVVPSDRWPGGVIPYVINSNLPSQERVTAALQHWNTNLSGVIQFIPRTNETDYVSFNPVASGCSAPVGYYAGEGVHPVELSDQCGSGNVAHEMGHVVGLDHEQNRLDRDQYVTINWDKINSGFATNFNISSYHQNYQSYDFGSLMHYALTAFSADGSQTITPRVVVPPGVTVGQRLGLSTMDMNSVREIYGATLVDTNNQPNPTPTPNVTGDGTGLYGHYYEGLDFRTLKRERLDSALDFDWLDSPISGVSADYFSVRWVGWLAPTVSGNYTISVSGQDGFRVKVGVNTIINNLTHVGSSRMFGPSLSLVAGQQYPIVVELQARTGPASMRLEWKKDAGTSVLIPADQLLPDQSAVGVNCTTP